MIAVIAAVHFLTMDDGTSSDEVTVSFHLADGGLLNVSCEVADNPFERAEGLQHREGLAIGSGMLFVYDRPGEHAFIMVNMNFPLDIVFIAENGTVLNVEEADVEPHDTPRSDLVRYRSHGEAKWVVEMNQGLSRQHGIGPGTQVEMDHTS